MLKIQNIDAVYGKIQVLHRTSLHIRTGEIVSLIGTNGAGKTTLLNVISGLHPVKSGGVLFLDREIQNMPPDRIVGMGLIQVPETDKIYIVLM